MEIIQYMKEDGSVPFSDWLSTLRDMQAKTAIRRRIDRFGAGNPGSTRSLRNGVSELKIDMGPGYRVYYALPWPNHRPAALWRGQRDSESRHCECSWLLGRLEDSK